jgi:hypothetical protein
MEREITLSTPLRYGMLRKARHGRAFSGNPLTQVLDSRLRGNDMIWDRVLLFSQMRWPSYDFAFVKLLLSRRQGRTGPVRAVGLTQRVRQYAHDLLRIPLARLCPCPGGFKASGDSTPNYLLSVLARLSQTPDSLFAQRLISAALASGSI